MLLVAVKEQLAGWGQTFALSRTVRSHAKPACFLPLLLIPPCLVCLCDSFIHLFFIVYTHLHTRPFLHLTLGYPGYDVKWRQASVAVLPGLMSRVAHTHIYLHYTVSFAHLQSCTQPSRDTRTHRTSLAF